MFRKGGAPVWVEEAHILDVVEDFPVTIGSLVSSLVVAVEGGSRHVVVFRSILKGRF